MINIKNLTIKINYTSDIIDESISTKSPVVVRDELIHLLRIIGEDQRFVGQTVVIPDDCEEYGFAEGEFNLPKLLYFLADMLE